MNEAWRLASPFGRTFMTQKISGRKFSSKVKEEPFHAATTRRLVDRSQRDPYGGLWGSAAFHFRCAAPIAAEATVAEGIGFGHILGGHIREAKGIEDIGVQAGAETPAWVLLSFEDHRCAGFQSRNARFCCHKLAFGRPNRGERGPSGSTDALIEPGWALA
jgi:hypothetical protein